MVALLRNIKTRVVLPVANQLLKFKTTYLLRYLELEGFLRDLGVSARVLFWLTFFLNFFILERSNLSMS